MANSNVQICYEMKDNDKFEKRSFTLYSYAIFSKACQRHDMTEDSCTATAKLVKRQSHTKISISTVTMIAFINMDIGLL